MTVAELLSRISSRELSEWIKFYGLEPFGSEHEYRGHAIVAQTVANSNRGKGKAAFKVEDFMPNFEPPEDDIEGALNFVKSLTLAMGGKDKRQNG